MSTYRPIAVRGLPRSRQASVRPSQRQHSKKRSADYQYSGTKGKRMKYKAQMDELDENEDEESDYDENDKYLKEFDEEEYDYYDSEMYQEPLRYRKAPPPVKPVRYFDPFN